MTRAFLHIIKYDVFLFCLLVWILGVSVPAGAADGDPVLAGKTVNGTIQINTDNARAFKVEQTGVYNNTFLVDTDGGTVAISRTPSGYGYLDVGGHGLFANPSDLTEGIAIGYSHPNDRGYIESWDTDGGLKDTLVSGTNTYLKSASVDGSTKIGFLDNVSNEVGSVDSDGNMAMAGNLTSTAGNFIPSTYGKGMDFSAAPSGFVRRITIANGGTGYSNGTLSATGGGGASFAGTYTVTAGVITAVTVTNEGSGYTSAPTIVTSDTGNGDAVLTPLMVLSTGKILGRYDAGYYTPALLCGISGTVTLDTSYDTLAYTRTGRKVTVVGSLKISAVNAPTGVLQLTLPFDVSNTGETSWMFSGSIAYNGIVALTTPGALTMVPSSGVTAVNIMEQSTTGFLTTSATKMQANAYLYFGFSYFTD